MKNKKKLLLIVFIAVLAAILAVLIGLVIYLQVVAQDNSTVGSNLESTIPTESTTQSVTEPATEPATEPVTEPITEPTGSTTEPAVDFTTEPPTVPVTEPPTEPPTNPPTNPPTRPTTPPTRPPTEPTTEPTVTVPTGVNCPYEIPGTQLVIDAINSYTGVFLEDGSDKDVANIYAIVLRNTASTCAEYIEITITREDGKLLSFVASAIDANSTVVVMEASATVYEEMEYDSCMASVAPLEKMEMSEDRIKIEEDATGSLNVTNISDSSIASVRIFYKFYMEDVNVFVGGITYTAKITNLAAGESKVVIPSHYAQNNSKIVMVKVYETEN